MTRKDGKILIVDDNTGILKSLNFVLKYEFADIVTIRNPNQIPSLIQAESFDVILLDMNFAAGISTGNEGIFWLRKILELDPEAVVVLITAYGDVELAVRAIKEGATDFILKPWDNEKLISTVQAACKLRKSKLEVKSLKTKQKYLKDDIDKHYSMFTCTSETMQKVYATIEKVAKTDANIMILGENGTGKELIARDIHRRSNRAKEVFVSVDMGSLSDNLFESELFGHVKGAYTDAKEDRKGRFEIASGGSLFLDEIGNLSLSQQAKLLTVLQNRRIIPVGSNKQIPIDIRLISATNSPILQLVDDGNFREDLLFRINTIQIEIPPLREHVDDIPALADFFLAKYAKQYGKPALKISSKTIQKLKQHTWHGNIRELRHAIEKAVILTESDTLSPDDFLFETKNNADIGFQSLNLEEVEKQTVNQALTKFKGNLSQAAKELGITRKTLYAKLEKYGL